MFAYTTFMGAYANTPDRKDSLSVGFARTIADTIVHRQRLKRKFAVKAAPAQAEAELEYAELGGTPRRKSQCLSDTIQSAFLCLCSNPTVLLCCIPDRRKVSGRPPSIFENCVSFEE